MNLSYQDIHIYVCHYRNPGTKTIDGIFGTPVLDIEKGGYAQFTGFSDRRLAGIDIRWESALGLYQTIQRPVARRLQCDDPRSVARYIKILESMLDEADILSTIITLENNASVPLPDNNMQSYEVFDNTITRCMLHAEKSAGIYIWVKYHFRQGWSYSSIS